MRSTVLSEPLRCCEQLYSQQQRNKTLTVEERTESRYTTLGSLFFFRPGSAADFTPGSTFPNRMTCSAKVIFNTLTAPFLPDEVHNNKFHQMFCTKLSEQWSLMSLCEGQGGAQCEKEHCKSSWHGINKQNKHLMRSYHISVWLCC